MSKSRSRCVKLFSRFLLVLGLAPGTVLASFLSGDALDTAADYMSWFVLCVVPIGLIALFWIVHVMPERIAKKRHHPQKQAIHTLCLLSLVFGGLLWPLAWLWAYTKPVSYKLAYGTDKHEDFYLDGAERAAGGTLSSTDLAHLKDELERLEKRGQITPELRRAKEKLAQTERPAAPAEDGAG